MKIIETDICAVYPGIAGKKAILTRYLPDNSPEIDMQRKKEAILVLPGGGYGGTSDREAEPVALKFAAMGFNAYVLRYSTAPAKYPEALLQAALSVRYIRENAAAHSTDVNKVYTIGFSAGGHLCATLGLLSESDTVKKAFKCAVPLRPDAIILSYPVISYPENCHQGSFDNLCGTDEKLKKELSMPKHVDKNSPPAFIWHTANDTVVPVQNSLSIATAYADAGVPFELFIYPEGPHGLSTADYTSYHAAHPYHEYAETQGWLDASIKFLRSGAVQKRKIVE